MIKVGKELANDLEKLQDRLPPFEMEKAKQILKNEIGQKQYDDIIELSKPFSFTCVSIVIYIFSGQIFL